MKMLIVLKDLDLWRSYVSLGATTYLECPKTAVKSARSDSLGNLESTCISLRKGV
jgi:hypothetical protein